MKHDFHPGDLICRRCGITTEEVEDNADLAFCFEFQRKSEQAVQKPFRIMTERDYPQRLVDPSGMEASDFSIPFDGPDASANDRDEVIKVDTSKKNMTDDEAMKFSRELRDALDKMGYRYLGGSYAIHDSGEPFKFSQSFTGPTGDFTLRFMQSKKVGSWTQ